MNNDSQIKPQGWLGLTHQGMFFEFQIVRMNQNEVRAYLLSHPSYGFRSKSLHDTHRLPDGNRFYVCPGEIPKTGGEAKQFAKYWCIYTEHYIRTGEKLI